MKILSLVTYYSPHWTGLTRYVVRLCEGLAERGHDVNVLTNRHTSELAGEEDLNGVHVRRLGWTLQVSRGQVSLQFPWVYVRMLKNCDVVFLHTPYPEALPAALLAKVYGKPFVMVHHGDFITPEGLGNRLLRTLAHWCLKLTGRLASAIVSYSRDYAEHSELLGPFLDKTIAIHPPVDIPQPNPDRSKTLRAQLGLTDKKTIGIAGRWVQEKGFDVLLMAFPGLLEIVPDAHIVFAGETDIPYDPAWRRDQETVRAMSSHITLLGLLKEPQQLADFYGMLDVFVLPSRSDMMALVQIEAMLCGVPVVATDIPGARVPVKETGFGRLASPNDPKALAKGVAEVLSDRPSYAPDVDAARAIFDPQKCFQAYERILGEIVPGGE